MKDEFSRIVLVGMRAGILATVVMDIFVALAMVLLGNPVSFMFRFIGEAASAFMSQIGLPIQGGVPLGFAIHYLLGLGLGGLFFAILFRVPRLRPASLGKSMLLGIIYIELFSQPFLASAPLVLRLPAADTLQWYALSTVMHAFYGAVLGALEHRRSTRMSAVSVRAAA